MKIQWPIKWKYIDEHSGCDVSPPKLGELFFHSVSASASVVLRETGDGGEFVDVGTYVEMRKKYGV